MPLPKLVKRVKHKSVVSVSSQTLPTRPLSATPQTLTNPEPSILSSTLPVSSHKFLSDPSDDCPLPLSPPESSKITESIPDRKNPSVRFKLFQSPTMDDLSDNEVTDNVCEALEMSEFAGVSGSLDHQDTNAETDSTVGTSSNRRQSYFSHRPYHNDFNEAGDE